MLIKQTKVKTLKNFIIVLFVLGNTSFKSNAQNFSLLNNTSQYYQVDVRYGDGTCASISNSAYQIVTLEPSSCAGSSTSITIGASQIVYKVTIFESRPPNCATYSNQGCSNPPSSWTQVSSFDCNDGTTDSWTACVGGNDDVYVNWSNDLTIND